MKLERLTNLSPLEHGEDVLEKALSSYSDNPWNGDVDPLALPFDNKWISSLLRVGELNGLKYKKQSLYTGCCLLPLYLSTGYHDDAGLGLVLNWLIDVSSFHGHRTPFSPQIAVQGKSLDLRVGDVFVFNASLSHCWISNHHCMLVQVPVSRSRKKKEKSL